MANGIINSDLYISVEGDSSLLDKKEQEKIEKVFKRLFKDSSRKVSETKVEQHVEIIFGIKTPIMREENSTREFFEKLEALLEALKENNPHFTQFKGVIK